MQRQFAIGYRTGGTDNFQWKRVLELYPSRDAANVKVQELRTMGYPAHVYDAQQLDALGLPETFEYVPGQHLDQ